MLGTSPAEAQTNLDWSSRRSLQLPADRNLRGRQLLPILVAGPRGGTRFSSSHIPSLIIFGRLLSGFMQKREGPAVVWPSCGAALLKVRQLP